MKIALAKLSNSKFQVFAKKVISAINAYYSYYRSFL